MVNKHLLYIFCLARVISSCSLIGEQRHMEERLDDLFTRYTDLREFIRSRTSRWRRSDSFADRLGSPGLQLVG